MADDVALTVNGEPVVSAATGSLLDVLREQLGLHAAKDGCSPQGQCGCCTVLVDGQPRVACVTPVGRVAGRSVTTVEGMPEAERRAWAAAFVATGGSQCGFCTPGIVARLSALRARGVTGDRAVRDALLAHLCRCTGWQTIVEAYDAYDRALPRDLERAGRRAAIEGRTSQRVGLDVVLGGGGFADDLAPADALVALRAADGSWVVGETLTEARALTGKVQGRRTTAPLRWPVELPPGDWARTLQTTWVEPAYLEPDASWCQPGGEPATPLANGGAFGGKTTSPVSALARKLADEHGRAVCVVYTREDVVRLGAKRPPLAAGVRADGTGVVRVARTPGVAAAIGRAAPGLVVEEVDLAGLPTSVSGRGAGWVEAAVLVASLGPSDEIHSPDGAVAQAAVTDEGVSVTVRCGEPIDEVVLRSYCIGAAHMALGWVRNEGIAVDDDGEPHDLTVRSFGVLRAVDTPPIEVVIEADDRAPVNGSDAVFAAVAAAAWRADGYARRWPTRRR
jgi:aerobic-type carbon monoxide dehydrogenase small subunit (CoxS/CutS family)